MAQWLKVAALAARKAMICISDEIPSGDNSPMSGFATGHNITWHFTGPGVRPLTGQPAVGSRTHAA